MQHNGSSLEDISLFQATFNVEQGISKFHDVKLLNDSLINVQECMVESYLTFGIPMEYLNLCLKYENEKIKSLQCIGELIQCQEVSRQKLIKKHEQAYGFFQAQLNCIQNLKHYPCFKRSVDKANDKWEFIPTNLHLQQIKVNMLPNVCDGTSNMHLPHEKFSKQAIQSSIIYNIVTVGAAANHVQGFKNGGLITQSTIAGNDVNKHRKKPFDIIVDSLRSKHEDRAFEQKLNDIDALFEKAKSCLAEWSDLATNTDNCSQTTLVQQFSRLQFSHLRSAIEQFLTSCSDERVVSSVRKLSGVRVAYKPLHNCDDGFHISTSGGVAKQSDMANVWVYQIENVKKNVATLEKFLNLFVGYDLESFLQGKDPSTSYLDEIKKLLLSLDSDLKVLRSDSVAALMLPETAKGKSEISFELQCRRSSVFSQALSMCACAVVALFASSLRHNRKALEQYADVGIFLQVESLLSTYGSEMGMIEDYAVAVYCLTNVTVKCVRARCEEYDSEKEEVLLPGQFLPWLEGSSDSPIVMLPFDNTSFQQLPDRLQGGNLIQIVPVIFNVGINEEQSLADRFGSSLLQESINARSLCDTKEYCCKLMKYSPIKTVRDVTGTSTSQNQRHQTPSKRESLHDLLQSLESAVYSKKRKNVEILRLSAAICRRVNGARVTSCKSAKDRTAMAATLEQVRLLQENHNMDPSTFNSTLERMRRSGTRLENTLKNVGARRYAFSQLQLKTFPRQYRAPEDTYGKVET